MACGTRRHSDYSHPRSLPLPFTALNTDDPTDMGHGALWQSRCLVSPNAAQRSYARARQSAARESEYEAGTAAGAACPSEVLTAQTQNETASGLNGEHHTSCCVRSVPGNGYMCTLCIGARRPRVEAAKPSHLLSRARRRLIC